MAALMRRGRTRAVLARAVPALILPFAAALLLGGCGNADSVPAHSAEEQKAIDELKTLTPEQQIDRIQKGGMPQAAKDAMIRDIKAKHGLK
ncbi:hypothetical protein EON79_17950 [bacterium]|nr:MAG: hypothetical protein EON79_17950 [bacterium]